MLRAEEVLSMAFPLWVGTTCCVALWRPSSFRQELGDIWPHPHSAWHDTDVARDCDVSVIVEISNLNKVKDPKRKVHKSVKGVLKLEVEKIHTSLVDVDNMSDGGSIIIDSNDDGDRFTETSLRKYHSNGPDIPRSGSLKFISINRKDICRNVLIPAREDHPDFSGHASSILSAIYQHSICNLALTHPEVQ